ncbi:DUF4232 domain-containing protein [Lentzea jiangxiensis]|uniref:DUF4232 domain-containing protein n=1 Tax=Lentzea jiangxiensis TaxID=641025 RepID=A0A1H0IAK1_9PSEU|nr:DUF4232 domain-containing protein [Lentzea jiangxiensis]SDO28447.1 Protein of unknown function [Lentzea jiangxiensis]
MRVTVLAVVLAIAATACATPTPGPAAQQTPQSTQSPASTSATVSDKREPTLKAELTLQGKPGLGLLTVTNEGTTPLTFRGWPKLSFTTPADELAAIPVEQKLVPGEGPSITLEPGRTAFAGVRLDVGDEAGSVAIGSMTAELPGATPAEVTVIGADGRPVADLSSLRVSEAEVGTLQPAAQGVLTFG